MVGTTIWRPIGLSVARPMVFAAYVFALWRSRSRYWASRIPFLGPQTAVELLILVDIGANLSAATSPGLSGCDYASSRSAVEADCEYVC
jgi:hypothetical protein